MEKRNPLIDYTRYVFAFLVVCIHVPLRMEERYICHWLVAQYLFSTLSPDIFCPSAWRKGMLRRRCERFVQMVETIWQIILPYSF